MDMKIKYQIKKIENILIKFNWMSDSKVNSNFAQNLSDNNISCKTKNEDTCLEISCKEDEWKNMYSNINSYYKENIIKNLVCVESCLTHDGYSKHGPDSNIYDIYIVHKSLGPENFIVDNWHTEYWYREDEVSFKLYQRIYSEEDFETYYQDRSTEKNSMPNEGNTYFVPWGQICY